MTIVDISPVVQGDSQVWPGDQPFEFRAHHNENAAGVVTVGTVSTTTHIGAHIDAPSHVMPGAPSIFDIPLDACIGPCIVLDIRELVDLSARPHGQAALEALLSRLEKFTLERVERLLLRHYSAARLGWGQQIPGVALEVIRWFAEQGGRLMGIDLASFDPAGSEDLRGHREAVASGVVMLEGLDLSAAPEGPAELIALPLPWVGADASPVRAVLRYP